MYVYIHVKPPPYIHVYIYVYIYIYIYIYIQDLKRFKKYSRSIFFFQGFSLFARI